MKITCLWLQNSTEMHIAYISSSNQKVLTHTGSSMKSVLSCNRMRQYYNPNFLPYWFLRIQILFYITHWCHHCMYDIFLPKFKVSKVWYKKKLILLNFGYTHVYLSLCVISVQNIFLQWRWPYTALSYINQNRISIISNTLHFPYIKPWNFSLHVPPQDENNNVWVSFCKCFRKLIYWNLNWAE